MDELKDEFGPHRDDLNLRLGPVGNLFDSQIAEPGRPAANTEVAFRGQK
jgi:hypothetical protein